jgi:hypothetical protein
VVPSHGHQKNKKWSFYLPLIHKPKQLLKVWKNQSTVTLCLEELKKMKVRNHVFHENFKHVEIWHHYICEHVLSREVDLLYIPSNDQIANIMTKPLGK